jgi:hypothetical protein
MAHCHGPTLTGGSRRHIWGLAPKHKQLAAASNLSVVPGSRRLRYRCDRLVAPGSNANPALRLFLLCILLPCSLEAKIHA